MFASSHYKDFETEKQKKAGTQGRRVHARTTHLGVLVGDVDAQGVEEVHPRRVFERNGQHACWQEGRNEGLCATLGSQLVYNVRRAKNNGGRTNGGCRSIDETPGAFDGLVACYRLLARKGK